MKRLALVLTACLVCGVAGAQEAPNGPSAALQARIARLEAAAKTTTDPAVPFLLAEAYAEAGQGERVAPLLQTLADRRAHLFPEPDSALLKLQQPEVGRVLARIKADLPVVRRGRVLAVLERPGLVPEGVALDPTRKRLLISDMAGRSILSVGLEDGRVRTFASGLALRPLGMKVRDGQLWLAATNAFWDEQPRRAELIVFDLQTGRRIAVHTHPEAQSFNDLDFTAEGDLYVSDSAGGTVFRLKRGAAEMERVLPKASLGYPNGVAVAGDGSAVYVAHGLGPTRINTRTLQTEPLPKPADLATAGIDGLYWRDGALIAVQSFGGASRLLRLQLDAAGRRITGHELLEAGGPHLTSPSTAALSRDRIYLLANAQVRKLRGDGTIETPLQPAVILETPLPAGS